jgi:hypothetical protein
LSETKILKPFGDYKTPGPSADVISLLEEMLEKAKHGEILAIAIAAVRPDGYVQTRAHKGNRGMSEIVGAVAVMQYYLMRSWNLDDV